MDGARVQRELGWETGRVEWRKLQREEREIGRGGALEGKELWLLPSGQSTLLAEEGVTWRAASDPQSGGRVCSDSY